jgi:hypothetical protein
MSVNKSNTSTTKRSGAFPSIRENVFTYETYHMMVGWLINDMQRFNSGKLTVSIL